VDLMESTLSTLSPHRLLRIVCAGVWQNGVTVLLSGFLLWSMPIWMALGYKKMGSGGVLVLATVEVTSYK
jgi:hypothetical protein